MAKRKIFDEMMVGVAAMKAHREGKLTLRSYKIELARALKVDSKLIKDTRERLNCSRAVFARKLHINERTLEKWEQGRAKPNPQAAALLLLVRRFSGFLTLSSVWSSELMSARHPPVASCQSSVVLGKPGEPHICQHQANVGHQPANPLAVARCRTADGDQADAIRPLI